jgi:uncharacterized protein (DUF2267 family)
MQYEDFIDQVLEKTNLNERDAAERLTEITLETLGERMYRTERNSLGAQLSGELKAYLNAREEPGPTRRDVDHYTLEEFYNRISARTELSLPDVRRYVPQVMSVLSEAVSAPVLEDAMTSLSEDFKKLL